MSRQNRSISTAANSSAAWASPEPPHWPAHAFGIWPLRAHKPSPPRNSSGLIKSPFSTTEKQNTYDDVTHYNNFYEFGVDKSDPSKNAQKFQTSPWSVSVEGEVKNPRKFSLDEIIKLAPLEERIYRHRCVEAWSIVVPVDRFFLQRAGQGR